MNTHAPRFPRWTPPLASALLLVLIFAIGGIRQTAPANLDAYLANVRAAVEDIDLRIGDWVGFDEPPMREAVDLMRPNIILQRSYKPVDDDTSVITLLVVHCADVRGMEGHNPPNCYPANGWEARGSNDRVIELEGRTIPVREYRFGRPPRQGLALTAGIQPIRVANFFIFPSDTEPLHREIAALTRASRSPQTVNIGAGQVQIASSHEFTDEEWNDVLTLFAAELRTTIDVIAGGPNDG